MSNTTQKPRRMFVPIERITRLPELQSRELADGALTEPDALAEAVEFVRGGGEFSDRPELVRDAQEGVEPVNYLCDGFRRVAASEAAGKTAIECDVYPGAFADAVIRSAGANRGQVASRRTNADKRRAVAMLLRACSTWSDGRVADAAGVSAEMVRQCRKIMHPPTVGGCRIDRRGVERPAVAAKPESPPPETFDLAGDDDEPEADSEAREPSAEDDAKYDPLKHEITAADAADRPEWKPEQPTEQPADDDAPAPRRPAWMVPGNHSDPDHPYADILTLLSTLSRKLTTAINAPGGEMLKKYLTYFKLVDHRDMVIEGKKFGCRFKGFPSFRRAVRLAGKDKRAKSEQQLRAACNTKEAREEESA